MAEHPASDTQARAGTLTPDEVLSSSCQSDVSPAAAPRAACGRPHGSARLAWACAAAVTVLCGVGAAGFSVSVGRAAAYAEVQQELALAAREAARLAQDELRILQQEHAVALDRARAAEADAAAARDAFLQQIRDLARLETEKRHAENALQAALSSLYQSRALDRPGQSPAAGATAAVDVEP